MKKINISKKIILSFVSFIASSSLVYSLVYIVASNEVSYAGSNLSATNVQGALDELYNFCYVNKKCPNGLACYQNTELSSVFQTNAIRDDIGSEFVGSSNGINFMNSSSDTNGKGLYLRAGTELSGQPIYYYRGAVTNNNVIFADYCWKIVRTTETGGIKLLYNGIANDSQCLETSLSYVGSSIFNNDTLNNDERIKYTYKLNGATKDSQMKIAIDNWYASHMTSYTQYLEDTVWCNDTTDDAYYRTTNGAPSTICRDSSSSYTVNSSNGNGKLTYPVGLLTVDELSLSGAILNASSSSYIGNASTMSEAFPGEGYLYYLNGTEVSSYAATGSVNIRPVISLKPGTTFSYGNGTSQKPYYVTTNEKTSNVLPMFGSNAIRDDIESEFVGYSNGVNFNLPSSDTNGKGLYLRAGTELTGRPIYYYRGAVTNNNVIFAEYCWKIVRTTETGGIKLVYNGIANDSQCLGASLPNVGLSIFNNSTLSKDERVKYTYELAGVTNDSQMKIAIDNWYASHMTSYTSYLEDTVWCNDSTGDAYYRAVRGGPTTICRELSGSYTVNSTNGNGKLTYPVGLLTADEVLLAGADEDVSNYSFYLGSVGTMSCRFPGEGEIYAHNGSLSGIDATSGFNIRPAISLKSGITFSYGNGTPKTPYYVTTNEETSNVLPMFENNAIRDDIQSEFVGNSNGVDFNLPSSDTNGKGLYLRAGTELTGRPIYYYRGAVTNNNVKFANYCWKIVRTTETGGIKLVYNGVIDNGKCLGTTPINVGSSNFNNNSLSLNDRVKYTYELNGVTKDSQMKIAIDNWYAAHMTSYTSYLEDTVWCNDSTGDAYYRSVGGGPTTICRELSGSYTVNLANGNGKLTYPVGLLTVDELLLAGAKEDVSNYSFYLGSVGTMSCRFPGEGDIYVHNGSLSESDATGVFIIRPAISLKSGVTFSSGNGTSNTPYVVATR